MMPEKNRQEHSNSLNRKQTTLKTVQPTADKKKSRVKSEEIRYENADDLYE